MKTETPPSGSEKKSKSISIYGVDTALPLSVNLDLIREELVKLRGKLHDLERVGTWKDRFDCISGGASTMIVALHYIIEERRKFEIESDNKTLGASFWFASRGIGMDQVPGCFVCGTVYRDADAAKHQYICMSNISAYVDSVEAGNTIVGWFNKLARFDFRPPDQKCSQVKVGACNAHFPNLEKLHALTSVHEVIRESMIEECKK